MRKFLHKFLNRIVITGLIVLIQIAFLLFELMRFSNQMVIISSIMKLLSVFAVCFILYKPSNPAVKLAWIVPILLFPLFGGILYLMFGHLFISHKMKKGLNDACQLLDTNMIQDEAVLDAIKEESIDVYSECSYIKNYAPAPVWNNTACRYFNDGMPYWKSLLNDLEKAEDFIFMEYFIIASGQMWDSILDILRRKVEQGVEVRLIFDDFGSANVLPKNYASRMEALGIRCVSFNRIVPFLAMILNNRDHRKIVVIDGKIGYTGGINLADEYINKKERFGYWKDSGLRIEGDAVWNMTVLFLQMWTISENSDSDISRYRYKNVSKLKPELSRQYVQPYGDSPLDGELVGESVYLNMINNAKNYIWIYTPYLVMDNVLMESLKLACKRGVDVRIVTPGIPDKKMVFYMTRCSYKPLIEAGARIFEYTPGFIHSKITLCDGEVVNIGTVNYDYRSLYHHFECGVLMINVSILSDVKEDMLETFKVSREIDQEFLQKRRFNVSIVGPVLHLLAPLL